MRINVDGGAVVEIAAQGLDLVVSELDGGNGKEIVRHVGLLSKSTGIIAATLWVIITCYGGKVEFDVYHVGLDKFTCEIQAGYFQGLVEGRKLLLNMRVRVIA